MATVRGSQWVNDETTTELNKGVHPVRRFQAMQQKSKPSILLVAVLAGELRSCCFEEEKKRIFERKE
jgi:hypothetical protein